MSEVVGTAFVLWNLGCFTCVFESAEEPVIGQSVPFIGFVLTAIRMVVWDFFAGFAFLLFGFDLEWHAWILYFTKFPT